MAEVALMAHVLIKKAILLAKTQVASAKPESAVDPIPLIQTQAFGGPESSCDVHNHTQQPSDHFHFASHVQSLIRLRDTTFFIFFFLVCSSSKLGYYSSTAMLVYFPTYLPACPG